MRPIAPRLLLAAAALGLSACDRAPAVETEPVQLTPPPFAYPEELWDAGVEGRTVLAIHIDTAGQVDTARVDTASGYAAFDSAALAGTRELRFRPATRDGAPRPTWVLLPVEFEITPADTGFAAAPQPQDTQAQ